MEERKARASRGLRPGRLVDPRARALGFLLRSPGVLARIVGGKSEQATTSDEGGAGQGTVGVRGRDQWKGG